MRRFALLLAALVLAACGGGTPDAAMVRAAFDQENAAQIGDGTIVVKEFTVEAGKHDRGRYIVPYLAQIYWPKGSADGAWAAGQVQPRSGVITFEKSDGGWRTPDGTLYTAR